ncbi:MAG: hypothetical protein ACOC32_00965, partial [Nanoarchaeota archaeon]
MPVEWKEVLIMSPVNKANYLEEEEINIISGFYESGLSYLIMMHDAPDPDACAMALMNYNEALRNG